MQTHVQDPEDAILGQLNSGATLGIIVQLAISWVLLWFVERQSLSALGWVPHVGRMRDLVFGLTAANVSSTFFANNSWVVNGEFTQVQFWNNLWYMVKSVLYEELIFRGALLYIAIRKIGLTKACILSAVCFGVYHWFSYGAFGNPVQMTFIFLMTAIAGLMFAFAYAKTKSLYLPIGLHLGWNFCSGVLFSNGPFGEQMMIKANENQLQGVASLAVFVFQLFGLPLLTYFYLTWLQRQDDLPASKFFSNEKSL